MKRSICGLGLAGLLVTGSAMAQYGAFWQEPSGDWKGPSANQPGQAFELAQNAARRACVDRGYPGSRNLTSKVVEKATGKEVVVYDCDAERAKNREAGIAPKAPAPRERYLAHWQEPSGEWKGTAASHPGLLLASAKGTAYEACKDRGSPKHLKRAAKVTEKETGKVVLLLDCDVERAKTKAESDASKAKQDAMNAKKQ